LSVQGYFSYKKVDDVDVRDDDDDDAHDDDAGLKNWNI